MPAGLPVEIGGHPVVGILSGEGVPPTLEARGPGYRRILLKGLDPDCLLKEGTVLHPNIRERLSRVRELALTGVANFLGVCRDTENGYDGYAAWLMWEYVDGQTFDEYAAAPSRSDRDLVNAARELILTIDSLHLQGIVHGSIKGSNVLIDPSGAIRLTHVSPLLYNDPAEDAQSTVEMLWSVVQTRGAEEKAFGAAVKEAVQASPSGAESAVRQLGARLAVAPGRAMSTDSGDGLTCLSAQKRDPWPRRRSLLAAAAIAVLGFAAAYGIWTAIGRPSAPLPRQLQDTIDSKRAK
jgi:tRNA A-37 threonylcarbamoyl transferase component Bud32